MSGREPGLRRVTLLGRPDGRGIRKISLHKEPPQIGVQTRLTGTEVGTLNTETGQIDFVPEVRASRIAPTIEVAIRGDVQAALDAETSQD